MVDIYRGPFGTYTNVQAIAAPLKTELAANFASLLALLDDGAGGAGHPDFNKIPAATRDKIKTEVAAMAAKAAAAP